MQSDGAVNLLCSGDLACEDAKLLDGESERGAPRSYTRPASLLHGHTNRARSGPLLPTLCYASTTRALGATQITMRQAGRADRTRATGGRTHVRALRWQTVARLRFACITELEAQGIDSNCNHANVVHAAKTTSIITLPLEYTTPCAYIRPSDNNKIFSMRIH